MPKNHPYVDGLWNPFMVKLWMVYHCFTNITSMNKTYTPMNSLHAAFECYVWMFIQFQVSALVTRSWYLADSCWFLTKRLQRRLFRLLQSCLWLESCSQMIAQIVAGWWYTYPSEKYESQLGWLFPTYGKIKMFQTTNQWCSTNLRNLWLLLNLSNTEMIFYYFWAMIYSMRHVQSPWL